MEEKIEGVSNLIEELKGHADLLNNKTTLQNAIAEYDWDLVQESLRNLYSYQLFDSIEKFKRCQEAAFRIGSLDFSTQVPCDDSNHSANYFAKTLNIIMEELSSRIFPCQEEIINSISDIVIVTDKNWNIIAINKRLETLCGYALTGLKNKHVSQIFEPKTFQLQIENGFSIKDFKVEILNKDKNNCIPVLLSVNEVKGFKNLTHNYTFIAKPLEG